MQTEIEAKWLNINLSNMRLQLKSIGATLVQPERLMSRSVFDYPDKQLAKVGGWVRVRDEGDKVTLSYKQLNDRTLHGTKEINLTVNNFKATCDFLQSIGLVAKSFQETKRESWLIDDVEVELDTWPWIPSFIEIEAKTEEKLRAVAKNLDLKFSEALHGSVEVAYQDIYDVTESEIDNWSTIRFVDIPDWLAIKRRQP